MRVLVAHNYYQQAGGEDQCVAAELAMLKAYGHEITHYLLHNKSIREMTTLSVAHRTIWSAEVYHELRKTMRAVRPEIVHFHNTFPLMSPSAYYAVRAERVPIVQTLHNFRLLCTRADFFRDGRVCEDCVGKLVAWPGVVNKCYRGEIGPNLVVATMLALHRLAGTWQNVVDMYIALSHISRHKLIKGGLPAAKIVVKPNFVADDLGMGSGDGGYVAFIGRLSREKGLETLINAWRRHQDLPALKVAGDGPMKSDVEEAAQSDRRIQCLGQQPTDVVYSLIGEAACLILPSECYENCPRVIIEAFARGTPAVVSELGAMAELVDDGRTGAHFRCGDPDDLATKVRNILANPAALKQMRHSARRAYEEAFTQEENHRQLMDIYQRALSSGARGG